jgi:hypothetical protein
MLELVILLITLTGPDQQAIEVNPNEIVALREPRGTDHFARGTRCLVFTSDGKYLSVMETCEKVHELIGENK